MYENRKFRSRLMCFNHAIDDFYRRHDFREEDLDGCNIHCAYKKWLLILLILIVIAYYYNISLYYKVLLSDFRTPSYINLSMKSHNDTIKPVCYKYLLKNSEEITMDYKKSYNSSYYWFMAMKHLFKDMGEEETPVYLKDTPNCQLDETTLGPVLVNKTVPTFEWIEQQNPDLKQGGYYAPAHCRAVHRVAIIVPYRDRKLNLPVFLRYIHPILKKQLLEYRVFVIEQFGTEQFNKGTLYNIAFLETQRFGTWNCLIFHDVDLIPENENILYSCLEYPTHMSGAVEAYGYTLAYPSLFGGVTSLTPDQYKIVNGYSNFYWSWGAEDDDMSYRLQSAKLPLLRYNLSIARFATLPHERNSYGKYRYFFLHYSKLRYLKEGLTSTKYNLISVTNEKLYTHILADVNPIKMKLDFKSMLRQIVHLFGNSMTYSGAEMNQGTILHILENTPVSHAGRKFVIHP